MTRQREGDKTGVDPGVRLFLVGTTPTRHSGIKGETHKSRMHAR
jgi:hypothetical protein